MKCLITGFEPFQNEKINPSAELAEALARTAREEFLVLPVSYQRAVPILLDKIANGNFEAILMLGLAGGRAKISLERFALNYADVEMADNDGTQYLEKPLEENAPELLKTKLPLRSMLASLPKPNPCIEISNFAGVYVCNALYYHMLSYQSKNQESPKKLLFVHLPFLPEQIKNKPNGTASLSFETQLEALQSLLQQFKKI